MTTTTRRSPLLAHGQAPPALIDAVRILETLPMCPSGAPASSSADGYEGQFMADENYLYIYRSGSWKRAALSAF